MLPQKTKAPPPRPPPPSREAVRQSGIVSQQDQDELAKQLMAAEQAAVESMERQEADEEAEQLEVQRLKTEIAAAEAEAEAEAAAEAAAEEAEQARIAAEEAAAEEAEQARIAAEEAAAEEAEQARIATAAEGAADAPSPVPVAAPRPQPRPRGLSKKPPPPPPVRMDSLQNEDTPTSAPAPALEALEQQQQQQGSEPSSAAQVLATLPPTKKAPPPPPNRSSSTTSSPDPASLPPTKKAPPPRPPSIFEGESSYIANENSSDANELFPDDGDDDDEVAKLEAQIALAEAEAQAEAAAEAAAAAANGEDVTADDLFPDDGDDEAATAGIAHEGATIEASETEVEVPREITLNTAEGQSVGMQLCPYTADGCGLVVHACDQGGQAEATGQVCTNDVITHVNGVYVVSMPIAEVAALIKSDDICTMRLVAAAIAAAEIPRVVTLQTSNNQTVGMKLKPTHSTGCGLSVLSVDVGGQAEATGNVFDGDIITHVNGIDISEMQMLHVAKLIQSNDTCDLRLILGSTALAGSSGGGDDGSDDESDANNGNRPADESAPARAPTDGVLEDEFGHKLDNYLPITTEEEVLGETSKSPEKQRVDDAFASSDDSESESDGGSYDNSQYNAAPPASRAPPPRAPPPPRVPGPATAASFAPAAARNVVLSTADGQSVGMQLKQRTLDGNGLVVHECDAGGQAEATGQIFPEDVITHVNSTGVLDMPMAEIAKLIKEHDSCTLTLEAGAAADAASPADTPAVARRVSQILTVYENEEGVNDNDDDDNNSAPKAKDDTEVNETVRLMTALMDGAWFVKDAKKYGKSRKRFFVLEPGQAILRYYAKFENGKPIGPKGSIALTRATELKTPDPLSLVLHTETREWKLTTPSAEQVDEWKAGVQMVVDGLRAVGGVVDQVSAKVNQSVVSPLSSGRMNAFTDKARKAAYRKSTITQPVEESFNHVVSVSSDEINTEELPEVTTPPPMIIPEEPETAAAAAVAAAATAADNAGAAAVDAGADGAATSNVPLAPAFPIPAWITGKIQVSFRQCIAFLAQPSVLKEEGLFRVSGNKTIIQQYDKAFDDGRSDVLRTCFEPATVCGLLKLRMKTYVGRKSLATKNLLEITDGLR